MTRFTSTSTALAVVLVLAGVLSACGGSSTSETSDDAVTDDLSAVACPLSELPESGEKVKISLWFGNQQGKNKEVMEELADAYNDSQDRVEITAADQGQDYASMLGKYTKAIQNDTIPNVLFADSSHLRFLVDSGTIIPSEACADEGVVPLDHLYPVVRSYYTVDGAYIPASVNLTSTLVYYNQVSYDRAGMDTTSPDTFDELRVDAEAMAEADIPDMEWPVSMVVSPGFFTGQVTGIGQDIVDNDNGRDGHATEALFDTPEVLAFLEQLQGMYDDGLVAKVSNTPGQIDQYLNVAQGKSAMVIETSAAATTIEAFLGGGLTAEELRDGGLAGLSSEGATVVPGIGRMPGIEEAGQVPVIGGAYFVTNGGSPAQQAAAMDFARFLNEMPQQETWLIEGSYLSANDQVTERDAVQTFFAETLSGIALQMASEQVAEVSPERSGPQIGPFEEYERIIQSMMESVMFNGSDPAEALADAEADVTAALVDYNQENGF